MRYGYDDPDDYETNFEVDEDDEDLRRGGFENLCECGRLTCGEGCCECGAPLCAMCFETGCGFCKNCPTENFEAIYEAAMKMVQI